ncbi:MAG: hypothetical protein CMK09_17725 [Ponticaulis sp.]|nr:hypothetical protein [Ponticaulis sp.]|tara:strand:+ start:4141 stop:4599 length:459 start_codon:yes stop_codon:yes gene_type:complete
MRGLRHLLSLVLAVFLIAVILHWTLHPWPNPKDGFVLLYDLPGEHIVFAMLAERSGIELFEPTLRVGLGCALLLAALAMVFSPLRRFGAGLTGVCCGVLLAAQVSPWGSVELAQSATSETLDEGSQFYLTMAVLTAAALLIWVHPDRKTRSG